jgi:hypothetical protein
VEVKLPVRLLVNVCVPVLEVVTEFDWLGETVLVTVDDTVELSDGSFERVVEGDID